MKQLTLQQHAKRIENINNARRGNKKYLKRHRICNYMPGQATYNLGDYPAPFSIMPTEYDFNLLKDMAEKGVQLVQIHEEWNDAIRHLGADKFTSFDPEGLQKFVDMCHYFGMKVIPYISSGYFSVNDPDYREDFIRGPYDIKLSYFHFAKCHAGSASWREYVLPRTFAVLDKYGFDGIYNDWGYDGIDLKSQNGWDKLPYDPEIEDLLATIYNEVHRRGGIYKLHADGNNAPDCFDRVYDYLWIGEGEDDKTVGIGKEFQPYVIPCPDMRFTKITDPDKYYASIIPFMQFPLLKIGRPWCGKSIFEDGIDYVKEETEYYHMEKVHKYMQEHPNGPYVYSYWSSIPDDVEEYPRWSKYLALYKPMVEENSIAYIELREAADILSELPAEVYASMFVNHDTYLVVSNMSEGVYTLDLRDTWKDRESGKVSNSFEIVPDRMIFLVKE